ncbi:hypothetical protein PVAP13_6KG159330 [Panicum virgatum]|uniref:Uncharacterized protein n=1 Tax=Panicum virgatum TaxID=38727 RepID=A0A8T0R9S4_PANVG|nr:hypothetical protein PVAP13_6KG159330 [Panicum virgatum]
MGFTGSLKRTQEEEVKGAPMVSHSRVHAPPPPPDMRVVRPNPLTTPDPLRFLATMKRELANETQK